MKQHLCKVDDLSTGKMKQFKVKNRQIVVVRKGNEFFAMHGLCPHQGAMLGAGCLTGTNLPSDVDEYCYGKEGEIVRCPWHNHEFDVTTGASIHNPKEKLKSYTLEIQGENVLIDI
jgi:nitrite reductase/ring-hydroxylating ferredoxin subunit